MEHWFVVNDMILSLKLRTFLFATLCQRTHPNPFKRPHPDMNRLVLSKRYFTKTDGARDYLEFCISVLVDLNVITAIDPTSPLARFSADSAVKVMSSELTPLLLQASKPHKRRLFFRSQQVSPRSVRLLNNSYSLPCMRPEAAGRWGEPLL